MKIINNLIQLIKKTTLLEKIVFIIIIIAIINSFSNLIYNKEGLANNLNSPRELTTVTGKNIFDEFYVNIYDDLVYNEEKNNYEVEKVLNANQSNIKSNILDVGCGTGHHIKLFNDKNIDSIGIDSSPYMIKKAKENYPKLNFKTCDALTTLEFQPDIFTHITCFYFTIYYIKNKKLFLENCFNWLVPGGVLILHLVDMNNFDPIIPIANPFVIISPQSYTPNRITESIVKFDTMDYKSNFKIDESIDPNTTSLKLPNAVFKEIFKFKDSNTIRINEHKFYMSSQRSILSIAKNIGFVLKSQDDMNSIQYDNNYLYTLQKPL
tara:strand:+ start:604 stop:1569 length:966 start_codon:yes stop_codon:yes gene_type:complete